VNTLGARVLSERLKCQLDLRPAFGVKTFTAIPNNGEAVFSITRVTNRYLILSDIYIWTSATPDQITFTLRVKGSPLPPFVSVVPMTLNSAASTPGQMSTLLEGIDVIFSPDESPVEVVALNNSGAAQDFRIYVFGLTTETLPPGLENWKYADLTTGV
jgi:hypothetical protein